jgi:hypothetical protein
MGREKIQQAKLNIVQHDRLARELDQVPGAGRDLLLLLLSATTFDRLAPQSDLVLLRRACIV